MADDFAGFAEQARLVLTLAQEQGQRVQARYLLTEHLLAGLMNYVQGHALLAALKIPVPQSGPGPFRPRPFIGPPAPLPLSSTVVRAIALAREETDDPDLRSDAVGIEHLLVGLVREEKGEAGRTLREHGLTPERIRLYVVRAAIAAAEKIASGAEVRIWGKREDVNRLLALSSQEHRPIDDLVWEAVQRTWFAGDATKEEDA